MSYVMTETQDDRNLPMMKEIGEYLALAYPGYTWHIRIDGGMLIIKNMSISDVWSMAVRYSSIAHDAKRRKHEVIMKAGEFLEAASLKRGRSEGVIAQSLEGRLHKNKFKPLMAQPDDIKIYH